MKQTLIRRLGSAISSSSVWVPNATIFSHRRRFSTEESLSWTSPSSSQTALLENLRSALSSRRVSDAWDSFSDLTRLHGLPDDPLLLHSLISELSSASEPLWLRRACELVSLIKKEKKPRLLGKEPLSKLCLSLARSQSPRRAAEILRLMIERDMFTSETLLRLLVMHLTKTEVGTRLAANLLDRVAELARPRPRPDATLFNLVLEGCASFGLGFRGEKIVESMARVGVAADAHSLAIVARIHEMNGQRDELTRFKALVDRVSRSSTRLPHHYSRFYDSLLRLHFKFEDIGSATKLLWEICDDESRVPVKISEPTKSFFVPIGSRNLRDGLKLRVSPETMEKDTVLKSESSKGELVAFGDGKLLLTTRAITKLVIGFRRAAANEDNIGELSKLLLGLQSKSCSPRGSELCRDVIEACARLGWLRFAHDVLDEVEASGSPVGRDTYVLLLGLYFKAKRPREAKALVNQMRKRVTEDDFLPDKLVIAEYLSEIKKSTRRSDLVVALTLESRDSEAASPEVYELNSSIHFFCKAKMIEDATRTYRRLNDRRIEPTAETFANMISGFSSLEMYREITILWGDMKRAMKRGNLVVNGDLCEFVLTSFIRGGYFERTMEVIDYMTEHGFFIDKSVHKNEFLKLHKDLYRKLKYSEAITEAQRDRLRYVLAFRKWAGI